MQWLRGFVYELKGTGSDSDEWTVLYIGIGCYRRNPNFQQTTEMRYFPAKREGKEHLYEYLIIVDLNEGSATFAERYTRAGRYDHGDIEDR
ncbi:hypothetical protein PHMEG_00015059 [Phytophthora megakarya]|uniref:Uncharacterized protein n=1 Tax=Phytophthora megakarya TaxID=4795 RepID=A0A225W3A7_9STRA|nr:hypothetical protein PHMEG_00015059 [Phytophthora megakarya]